MLVAAFGGGRSEALASEPSVAERLNRLEADVRAAEDLQAIKKLQRAYGYYLDKGMWEDLAALFTDDAVANYPAGVFVGHESIRKHLFLNVGNVKMGQVGLGDNRLYNHMNIQPVVHLDPSGVTARGRWRAFAMFGSLGGGATWAEGVYEIQYRKEGGVWKISKLDYYSGFGAPYATGWTAPPNAGSAGEAAPARPRRKLAHPPDRERNTDCDGFAPACIAPFHYENPGTAAGGNAWDTAALAKLVTSRGSERKRLADLAQRAALLKDAQDIENLQRIYGYYLDRNMWDQVADLFAEDGTIEWAQQGVYVGKQRVRAFLDLLGPHGATDGVLNDHIQLQPIVDVAPDGRTARLRSREFTMTGQYRGTGTWSEGTYENTFVKQNGVWKFQSLHFYPTFITDYDKGWGKDAQPAPAVSAQLPPDRSPTQTYEIYPKANVPPFHYRNPVTGEPPHYPEVGGPGKDLATASLMPASKRPTPPRVTDREAVLAAAENTIARVKDFHELENLTSAYGYYLDKNLWNDLADLFSRDGSMELAQRGVYRSQKRVREFLLTVFGRGKEGPVAGRLGNHVQMQPVIHVADDGKTAKIRVRMMQQLSFGRGASMGGSIYENEAVKEDGVWKLRVDHTYNTWTASYKGGWMRGVSGQMPGPSKELPPDAPPTLVFRMFPNVYDIPFHYANPVTGRTELPPITHVPELQIAAAIRAIGPIIDGKRTGELYAPLQPKEPYENVSLTRDVKYGPHERHVLDIFTSPEKGQGKPVVVFVHGGGFAMGSKHTPGSPFYDNVGLWAASHGLVGVTINYRLAPQFQYPSGVQDLRRVVDWLRAHIAGYGGDPEKIFLWGHSAGAAHAADYLANAANEHKNAGVRGAILTSGFYDLGDTVSVWKAYYGEDVSKYKERSSIYGLVKSDVPLLVTDAELDPETFKPESDKLAQARAQAGKPVRRVTLADHSHLSELYAVNTGDVTLSGPVLEFIKSLE
ncbi:MAG TPA: nuclear transport factor 2 family protein [Steroidobacteraceae bacterium]|nr:nuclear transport factor 2 family protein [Steroidobacteraceae bacterium]